MNFQDPVPPTASTSAVPRRLTAAQRRKVAIVTAAAVVAVIAVLVGFDALRSYGMKKFFANNKPPPLAVNSEVVQTGRLAQSLSAIGSVAAVHQVAISAEVGGQVSRIAFQAGTAVKKGELLVQLNDAPEQADLAASRAQQRLAKVSLDRARQLTGRGFVAQAQLDQAQSQYDAATAAIARDEALIAQKQVRAPFDGTLGVRLIEVGQYLQPGTAMVVLTDVSFLYVDFTLPEQARPQLALGQDVAVTVDAYPGRSFRGRIYVIDPQINPDTRTIKMQAVVENSERLLMAGMFANVRVALPPREDVMTVAETALDHTLYGDSVYVVRTGEPGPDGKPQLKVAHVPVTAGERADGRVAVTGLKPGDRVVTAGQVKLFEGAAVTLAAEPVLVKPAQVPLD
jgi:multidrug efflux system membrane fusion protein